jgi:hypothetical protein
VVGADREYYRLYFQEPGVAEADLEADVYRTVRGFLYSIGGDVVTDGFSTAVVPQTTSLT